MKTSFVMLLFVSSMLCAACSTEEPAASPRTVSPTPAKQVDGLNQNQIAPVTVSDITATPAPVAVMQLNGGEVATLSRAEILRERIREKTQKLIMVPRIEIIAYEKSVNFLPPEADAALQSATTAVLYSIEPRITKSGASDQTFHNFQILGKTELNGGKLGTAIAAFRASVSDWKSGMGLCFQPRHALRVTTNGHNYDFILCYKCEHLMVYEDDNLMDDLGAAGKPQVLNDLLTAAQVPLAKQASGT